VLAAATIVLTIAGSPRLNRVTSSNRYRDLWSMFLSATKVLGLLTVAAILALIFDRDTAPEPLATYLLLFFLILAIQRVATCIWILDRLTALMVRERNAAS
jgi:hypothetical protein